MDLKALIARLARMIGLGPTSELARPSDYGTGHEGTDRGTKYVRRPRAHGEAQQREGDYPERPSMPTIGDAADFQSPGGDQPVPKRRPPRPFRDTEGSN